MPKAAHTQLHTVFFTSYSTPLATGVFTPPAPRFASQRPGCNTAGMRTPIRLAAILGLIMPAACTFNPAGGDGSSTATGDSSSGSNGQNSGGSGGSSTGGSSTGGSTTATNALWPFCDAPTTYASPLPANPTPTPLSGAPAHDHFDGPVWRADTGKLVYSAWNNTPDAGNGPESVLVELTPPNGFTTLTTAGAPNAIGTNGLAVDGNGVLVGCAHDQRQVARFPSADGNQRQVIAGQYNGKPFNSPNDAAIRADGTIYFTDPDYQADGRTGQGVTGIYQVTPSGQVFLVDGSRNEPNGIALSLDQNWLYVGGNDNVIQRYPIAADGSTGPGQAFIDAGTNVDGMGIDCAGNVYASLYASNKVGVWNASGHSIGEIPVAENVTNVAFGGSDHKTLYITTVTHLSSIVLQVPGLPY